MTRTAPKSLWMAQLATVTGSVLAALGVSAVVLGTALYDHEVLDFPTGVQIAVVVGVVGLAMVPCTMLLRAAQWVLRGNPTAATSASIGGGVVLLTGVGAVAFFKVFANPCWDNPSCTDGSSVADSILAAALLILLLAAAVALLLSPLLLHSARRSAEHVGSGHGA